MNQCLPNLWNESIDPTEPRGATDRVTSELQALRNHMDRLAIACQGMWELLRDFSELTEEDIENKIREIDVRDGTEDGKMTLRQVVCPSCGRMSHSKRTHCIICGAPVPRELRFDV